jgi:maleate isomerase
MSLNKSHWGHKIGVLTPATNVTVENELWQMQIPGATMSTSRIIIDGMNWTAPNGIQKFVEGVAARLPETVNRLQFKPDSLLLGISSSSLWGGLEGNERLKAHIKELTGLNMVTPADGVYAAVKKFNVKKIGVITPFPSLADGKVTQFFADFGVEVLAQRGLRATNPIEIGEISEDRVREAVKDVNVAGVEAILQLGTDLRMGRVAPQAEAWLGKPVLSINATTWWHCLRHNGFTDQVQGWGSLLANH